MKSLEVAPNIYLINLSKTSASAELLCLDTFSEQRVLLYVIDTFLKYGLKMTYEGRMSLARLPALLASFFNRLNSDDFDVQNNIYPPWDKLITWFFYHLCVPPGPNYVIHCPLLLKIDNRVFFEIHYENNFPPEVLSKVTKAEYPELFPYIKREGLSAEGVPCFTKYLMLDENQEEYLLMPEMPIELRGQIRNFNGHLIENYHTLTFEDIDQREAPFVLEYLTKLHQFIDPEPLTE